MKLRLFLRIIKKHLFQIDKAFKHPNPKGKRYIRNEYKKPLQIKGFYFNQNNEEINFKEKPELLETGWIIYQFKK